jgi:hypothetical protein
VIRLPEALQEELEILAMEAQRGEAPGPGMARRMERDVIAAFSRYGLTDVRVQTRVERGGLLVRIDLPKPGSRVERVVITLGGM